MIIAIDGPAGSGKSTVAKLVAEKLGYLYIDSGAMYRAVTLLWLEQTDCKQDQASDTKLLDQLLATIEIKLENNSQKVFLNTKDVSADIRKNIVSQNVSYIASFQNVREKLVELQREISENHDVVMDGRDIATVVFPNADLKVFMVASPQVRAERRQKELALKGETIELDTLVTEIIKRDEQDSNRKISPLSKANDAIELNTDNLNSDEVVVEVLKIAPKSKKSG